MRNCFVYQSRVIEKWKKTFEDYHKEWTAIKQELDEGADLCNQLSIQFLP